MLTVVVGIIAPLVYPRKNIYGFGLFHFHMDPTVYKRDHQEQNERLIISFPISPLVPAMIRAYYCQCHNNYYHV